MAIPFSRLVPALLAATLAAAPLAHADDPCTANRAPGAGAILFSCVQPKPHPGELSGTIAPPPEDRPVPANPVISNWFNRLSDQEQRKFLSAAAAKGLRGPDGKPLTQGQFADLAPRFDVELARQGLSTSDNASLVNALDKVGGIKPATDRGYGETGATDSN